jgi:adenylosuccinate lyase
MIARYTRKEMGEIWSERARFQTWLDIEILACQAQSKLGSVPAKAVSVIRRRAKFDPTRSRF